MLWPGRFGRRGIDMDERKDGGAAILVSSCDRGFLLSDRWLIGTNGYVYRSGGRIKGRECLLHRLIMKPQGGYEIHHKNGNKLDNRRENLEIMTASGHQAYHKHIVVQRNRASRKYPLYRDCLGCGNNFEVHPDHRGRNRFCSRSCGNKNRRNVYAG